MEQRHNDIFVPTSYPDHLKSVYFALRKMAEGHIGPNKSLQWLESKEELDFQDPNVSHVQGEPVPQDVADKISPLAQPGYIEGRNAALKDTKIQESIARAAELISDGRNVIAVTAHDNIIDIAMALLTVRDMLTIREGVKTNSTSILVSKMVSHLSFPIGGQQLPAVNVLKLFCDDIYMSFPRTSSAKGVLEQVPEEFIKAFNNGSIEAIRRSFAHGGALMGIAVTGTTREHYDDSGRKIVPKINEGTKDLITNNALLMPVELKLEGGFEVKRVGSPTKVSKDEVEGFMNEFSAFKINSDLGSVATNNQ